MFHHEPIQIIETPVARRPERSGACLVAGCPCKDARIISPRRAAFFAEVARRSGETANRAIAPDAGWRLPASEGD